VKGVGIYGCQGFIQKKSREFARDVKALIGIKKE